MCIYAFDVCFLVFCILAEDEEETIEAQEKVEGNVDHAEELDDLTREGRYSLMLSLLLLIWTLSIRHCKSEKEHPS